MIKWIKIKLGILNKCGLNKETTAHVLKALNHLSNTPNKSYHKGICYYVLSRVPLDEYNDVREALHLIFKEWPHYSGSAKYPIPPRIGERDCAYAAQSKFMTTNNLWDLDSQYGTLRHKLLNYIIDSLQRPLA